MTNKEKRKRILEARNVLKDEYKRQFKPGHWDIKNNRLYSNDMSLMLELDETITNRGAVYCLDRGN